MPLLTTPKKQTQPAWLTHIAHAGAPEIASELGVDAIAPDVLDKLAGTEATLPLATSGARLLFPASFVAAAGGNISSAQRPSPPVALAAAQPDEANARLQPAWDGGQLGYKEIPARETALQPEAVDDAAAKASARAPAAALHAEAAAAMRIKYSLRVDQKVIVFTDWTPVGLADLLAPAQRPEAPGTQPLLLMHRVLADIGRQLHRLHDLNVVHHNVSLSNIAAGADGPLRLFLSDMPSARFNARFGKLSPARLGAAGYMSPEVAGDAPYYQNTDVFSLGLVAAEMMTGEPLIDPHRDVSTPEGWAAQQRDLAAASRWHAATFPIAGDKTALIAESEVAERFEVAFKITRLQSRRAAHVLFADMLDPTAEHRCSALYAAEFGEMALRHDAFAEGRGSEMLAHTIAALGEKATRTQEFAGLRALQEGFARGGG